VSASQTKSLLVEFLSGEELLNAVRRVRRELPNFALEAYSPCAVEGMEEALGHRRDGVAGWMLLGAVIGGVGTYALEWYSAVFNYPINVGGRPTASWPAFLPPALEMTVLGAAVFGVVAMLIGNGLPRLNHPLFDVKAFERASADRFFMLVRLDDPNIDVQPLHELCTSLSALRVEEVAQ
jgi:Protein of unknown function (DUF3341)